MNVTSLSRGVPVSSQPFSALDRNLIAIMKHCSYSSVKNHCFYFWTKLWQLPPIWINFTQASQQFFTLWLFITHYYLSAQWLPSLWRTCPAETNKQTDSKQPSLPSICSQGSKTCHVWWQEELHRPPTQHPRGTSRPRVMVQPCQWQVLWFWSRGVQRHECLHWAPK